MPPAAIRRACVPRASGCSNCAGTLPARNSRTCRRSKMPCACRRRFDAAAAPDSNFQKTFFPSAAPGDKRYSVPIDKIIVLEDDLIVRKSLEQQLRHRRYDVASASTIAAAQDLLTKDNFDLMIVDVRLPDGEGTDLLKQLQARPVKPLVVIISGFGSVESAVDCMRNGAFDYLIKPFSAE